MVWVRRLSARAVLDEAPGALAHAEAQAAAGDESWQQWVAELASGDLTALAGELAQRGHELDLQELGAMYVHVELGHDVRGRVDDRRPARLIPED
jgi:hypothetical protein